MQKNKTNIKIRGKEYTVVGPETPEYMQKIASYIDNKIGEMMVANPTLNLEMGSVLAAINIVDEYFKALETSDNLRKHIGEYLDDMSKSRNEINNLRAENKMLKSRLGEQDKG